MTFVKGQSGNPKGPPPGTRHKATRLAEQLLDGQVEALTQKCVEMALGGDGMAMRICLERILPARKSRPVTFDLPQIETAADVTGALGTIAKAMATGELTPDEAGAVAGVIEAKRRAIETVEHEERLRKLEEGMPK
jgi:Family of unknown function (DUF5681)